MNSRGCFENRTFHIYTEHNKNPKCCNESSEYVQKLKFSVITNDTCRVVASKTNGLGADVIARTFGKKYPNYQLRYDAFDMSCNKLQG